MKISVDDQELFTLSETQKKVIQNDISIDEFMDDMKRRLQWVLMHKYERCLERLKTEWESRLIADGAKSLPTDKDEYCNLIFSRPDYKCRKTREEEAGRAHLKVNPSSQTQ